VANIALFQDVYLILSRLPKQIMKDRAGAEGDGESDDGDDRYGAIETGGGKTVIYDREQPTAWLQSDYTVPVA